MADLKINIDLEKTGTGGADAADDLTKVKSAAGELTTSLPEGWAGLEKYRQVLKVSGESAEASEGHIRNLRALMSRAGPRPPNSAISSILPSIR